MNKLLDRLTWEEGDLEFEGAPTRRDLSATAFAPWRDLTPLELNVNLTGIDDRLDRARDEVVQAAADVQKKQIDNLLTLAEKLVTSGDAGKVARADVPYGGEMALAIGAVLQSVYGYGAEQVHAEVERIRGRSSTLEGIDPLVAAAFISARARALVSVLNAKIKSAFTWEVLLQLRTGIFDRAVLLDRLKSLSDRELVSVAQGSTSEALNLGRRAAAKDLGLERAEYSALLDSATCDPCRSHDGESFDVGSDDYERISPPNPDCYGGGRCRCLWVYDG